MTVLADAEVAIIGGGAIGCGVAYALAQAGKTDVLLLESRPELAAVTTSQGAGLCGQARSTPQRTRLAMASARTFLRHQQDPVAEVRPGWRAVGSLRLAQTDARAKQFRALKTACDAAGLAVELISRDEARRHWPALDFKAVTGVLWCPTDGYMDPRSVVNTYRYHAGRAGVRFMTDARVIGIECVNGRVDGVVTTQGRVGCRTLVNAAGAHAYHIAHLVGLELPIVPVRHEYFISGPLAGLHPELPCFRIPDDRLYGRAADDRLLLGGWEERAISIDPRTYSLDSQPPPVEPDWPVLKGFANDFAKLWKDVVHEPVTKVGRGWPTFTPDGRFIIGPSGRVPGFVMAGGCNAHGISGSPGIGQLVVESILETSPSDYVRTLSPDRFSETTWTWEEAIVRARRVYETYYHT